MHNMLCIVYKLFGIMQKYVGTCDSDPSWRGDRFWDRTGYAGWGKWAVLWAGVSGNQPPRDRTDVNILRVSRERGSPRNDGLSHAGKEPFAGKGEGGTPLPIITMIEENCHP